MSENANKIQWPGWETIGMIGRGSFGAVYEIERKVFDDVEKAALKVITIPQNEGDIEEMYSDGYDEESITSTFQSHLKSIVAEYSLMRKMNGCVNIVNCDDIHYEQHEDGIGWDIFIKMELLTPLIKALPETITDEQVIKIAKDMCAALDVCKSYGIVHRDIKPQNIFVSAYGDYKLGDFGIAKTVEKTMSGTVIGTYKYMAPEVYNNQPYGTSADIYSLGLVLYWLLNERRMPFMPLPPEKLKHGMEEESRSRRFSGEPLPPPAHGSERLKKIVLKACAYNPADRYSSAAEMLQDLNGNDNSVVVPLVTKAIVEEKPEEVLYTIRFRDEDGVLLSSKNYKEGEKIELPTIMERQIDGKTYKFKEWSPAINERAKKSVEYRAVYKEKVEAPVILPAADKKVTSISQPQKSSNKKWIVAALALLVVGIFAVTIGNKDNGDGKNQEISSPTLKTENNTTSTVKKEPTKATESVRTENATWSDWVEKLPSNVSDKNYEIETKTQYRSKELETTTSDKKTKSGWELYDTISADGGYTPWSNWSQTAVNGSSTRSVESATWYRYRERETATGTSKSKNGWSLYDTTYEYGNWSGWSAWGLGNVSSSETRDVERQTMYSYRTRKKMTSDSIQKGYTVYDSDVKYGTWSEWSTTPSYPNDTLDVETKEVVKSTSYRIGHYCTGNVEGAKWQTSRRNKTTNEIFNANCVYHELGTFDNLNVFTVRDSGEYIYYQNGNKYNCSNSCWTWYIQDENNTYETLYRSRPIKTTYYMYSEWSDWSEYDADRLSENELREERSKEYVRVREREKVPVYHFERWSDWSKWSPDSVSANNSRQVETTKFYRYKDKVTSTTYCFRRWTDWSEFSDQVQKPSDSVKVETRTLYRYKSK